MKGKILIVDDEKNMRKSLEEILRLEGYEVESVGDGKSAVKLLENGQFDLMLLDLKMQGMDGLEVLDFSIKHAPTCKVIMLTALSQEADMKKAKDLKVDDYLVKSQVVIADVVERIKYHLGMGGTPPPPDDVGGGGGGGADAMVIDVVSLSDNSPSLTDTWNVSVPVTDTLLTVALR